MFTDTEWVRVAQTDTDWELSVTRAMYDSVPYGYVLLDEPACDAGNNPLPPTHKTSDEAPSEKKPVARQAAKTGHEADTKKES